MNETVKTLLISLSCVLANFGALAVVVRVFITIVKKHLKEIMEIKAKIKATNEELVKVQKKLVEVKEALEWQVESDQKLRLEMRGIKSHGEIKEN